MFLTLLTRDMHCLGGDLGGFGGDMDEEGFSIVDTGTGNADDDYFDEVAGCLQEILLDEEFE